MPTQIFTLDKVPEDKLIDIIQEARGDGANIVTAVNDNQGTFTIDETFLQPAAAGAAGTITLNGKMSVFGGPNDPGVAPDEGLALFEAADVSANPDLFLPTQPNGTTGLCAPSQSPSQIYRVPLGLYRYPQKLSEIEYDPGDGNQPGHQQERTVPSGG